MMNSYIVSFESLDDDMTLRILTCLDDPGDVVRASSVSRSWHDFIISNAVIKQLCLRIFPQLSSLDHTVDAGSKIQKSAEAGCSHSNEWEHAVKEHKIFSSLARNLTPFEPGGCIAAAISASSTDYPYESIHNTLDPRDIIGRRESYWSSSGQSDPSVPERLTYKLASNFCVVSEINIQPFQGRFEPNFPIYSAKAVRFHLGHQIMPDDCGDDLLDTKDKKSADVKFAWTYTSPEFPMTQVDKTSHWTIVTF